MAIGVQLHLQPPLEPYLYKGLTTLPLTSLGI